MKNFTLTLFTALLAASASYGQTKSTGTFSLIAGMTAKLDLNNTNTTATLTLTGPSDRWFALAFGSEFPTDPDADDGGKSGMAPGNDVVYYNGTTLVDCRHNGIGETPSVDATNNWTVSSNTVAGSTRTIVATRAFNTGDANDFTFNYDLTDMDFAASRRSSASYTFSSHAGNRQVFPDVPLTPVLAVDQHALSASSVFPNPSKGQFTVKTVAPLEKINVYTQTGAFVKTVEVNNTDAAEVSISGLSTGIYLLELQNSTEKSWKKIIIE